jgi:hypothetical protein
MSGGMFWIREGDSLPVIKAVIIDSQGAVVDLTAATAVSLEMRRPTSTSVFATHTGSFVNPKTSGTVQYAWQTADTTGNAGNYLGHWIVTWTGGGIQSFPTDSAFDIIIASATGYINGYGPATIYEARQRAGEVGDTHYSDEQIADLLTARSGDTAAVAFDIWSYKASDAANLVDVSEAGSSRKFSDLYKQCLEMAKFWGDQSPEILALQRTTAKPGSRTRGIERP